LDGTGIAQDRLAEFIGDHAGASRATLGDILETGAYHFRYDNYQDKKTGR
jgi:hypothetical protein